MFFDDITQGPLDPVYILKSSVDADQSPDKVDLGVGVYRNEEGKCHEMAAIQQAKTILSSRNPGHDYETTTGDAAFVRNAAALLFGKDSLTLQNSQVASVQTISGTGSIHLAALFLSRCNGFSDKQIYLGTPAWGNYEPLFNLVGLEVVKYRYYDSNTGAVDFNSLLNTVLNAPKGSVIILQGCCHNPSGADLSRQQWSELAAAIKTQEVFPLFDIAYQGLGSSLEEDAFGLRHFEQQGMELIACQSFSKNFGLYGERCGVLHVVGKNNVVATNVHDQLRCLIRWEFSSSPAFGSRLVNIILEDKFLTKGWSDELLNMRKRLQRLRGDVFGRLVYDLKTPGDWSTLLTSTGLFCFLPLSPQQASQLAKIHHIYMFPSGRINISGINQANIAHVVNAIDQVARDSSSISAHL